ncbi:MAG: circadian clock protein KaiA [Leptolyngbya sp. SIO1D8]|nr:circadian clock protein KaiA [Leptolyngbya sp. SIO1D8]
MEAHLDAQNYRVHVGKSQQSFFQWIGQNRHRIDCLVLEPEANFSELLENLQLRDILLPTLILETGDLVATEEPSLPDSSSTAGSYHKAIVCIHNTDWAQLEHYIHQAINQFLKLPHNHPPDLAEIPSLEDTRHFLLSLQQQRLSEKLRERLGYLGVYYKRNSDSFLRNLPAQERAQLLEKLRLDYRAIILSYFDKDSTKDNLLNQKIDSFVNTAFLADVSVSQIVEIHMELMDSFSKQLKLEGRNEEILLDYRLTLIDVIAHLCEMYRRSIPREM